jgi:amidase
MSGQEILSRSALDLAHLIRARQVSSEDVVRVSLDRIARLNPSVQAFVSVFETAINVARAKDRQTLRGGTLPLFHGVPIGIKDLNVVRWSRTRFGSRAVPSLPMPWDDLTVAPLRRAGFVILGKLSTSEFGALPVTEPVIHRPTRNPWALSRSAGGSSGGSAAAVAAEMLPVSQGSDGAGSIRIPASFCHTFGIKPARGRVVNQFGLSDRQLLYTSGPMSRTVSDAAAMLDVMAGLVAGRPHWAPPPPHPFRERATGQPRRFRIGLAVATPIIPTHPEILERIHSVVRLLADSGHDIVEANLPTCSVEEFLPLWQYQVGGTPLCSWHKTEPVTRWLGRAGRLLSAKSVAMRFEALKARYEDTVGSFDLLITPTVAVPPPMIGAFSDLSPPVSIIEAAKLVAFTAMFNLVGLPAASVPVGFTADGLPIGLQVVGSRFGECDVLELAWQLEEALPWAHLRPSLDRSEATSSRADPT